MNGGSYEEPFDDEEFSDYEEDDEKPERHRSRSRKHDRKHHHSSKKHRRHRKRSRSRSRTRSRERKSGRVHINPNFTNLGPTASSLLETNNILEAEVVRLRNELGCTSIRIRALENELSNGAVVRGNLEQELSISRLNYQKLQQTSTKNTQIISSLKSDIVSMRKEKEGVVEKLKQTEMQLSAHTEQVAFLTKRNEVLGKKCEELVDKNRICREERDDALQLATSMKREVENIQSTLDLRLAEYKRLDGDLATARDKERLWKIEKLELERKLAAKDSSIAAERKRMEEQRKRDKAQLSEMEKKLKCEQPGWESQLGVEAVFRAIETIKNEFSGQIEHLTEQVIPLKEKSSSIAAYQLASSHPPRIHSAPPLSDVHIPLSSSLSCPDARYLPAECVPVKSPKVEVDSFTEQELIGGDDDVELSDSTLIQIDEEVLLSDSPH
uniref:Myosin-6-like n=1 Tax=Haemonchus contortus TaxID=6289 RepID=W6N9L2_HAECO